MTEASVVIKARHNWNFGFIVAALIAMIFVFPIVSIVWISTSVETSQWTHLISTVLPRYLTNSLILMAGVGLLSLILGTSLAYLITHIKFPGSG
ncbi:MAG: iron ABC transporter permease, partial [Planktomarina sp.]|nr:iron ABC transporter permease [Planktomarina sp.]